MLENIYASSQTQPFSPRQLTELLARARQNNQELGVSGLLLFHRGSFLQVLEGEDAVVTALYEKIETDPRHDRLRLIKRGPITERTFGGWSMGFAEANASVGRKLEGFNTFLQSGVVETEGVAEQVRKVLHAFRAGHWRQNIN